MPILGRSILTIFHGIHGLLRQKYPVSFYIVMPYFRQEWSSDRLRNSRPILAEVSWFSAEVLTIFGWSTISGSITRDFLQNSCPFATRPFATDVSVIVSMKSYTHSWQKYSVSFYGRYAPFLAEVIQWLSTKFTPYCGRSMLWFSTEAWFILG